MLTIRCCLSVVFLLISSFAMGQVYPNLQMDRKLNPDKNNVIYTPGKEFVYNYTLRDAEGREFKIVKDSIGIVPSGGHKLNTVHTMHIGVVTPKLFKRSIKGQTAIIYSYYPQPNSFGLTGAVENSKNVWIHPPREDFFQILEICPFPYVKYPLEVGTHWIDKVNVHDWWSSPLWLEWEGRLLFEHQYKITGKETVDTDMGEFNCWMIEATGYSSKGNTKLVAYFNETVGFVKLIYRTVNSMSIIFVLKSIENNRVTKGAKNYYLSKFRAKGE